MVKAPVLLERVTVKLSVEVPLSASAIDTSLIVTTESLALLVKAVVLKLGTVAV